MTQDIREALKLALETLIWCEPDCEENQRGYELWCEVMPLLRSTLDDLSQRTWVGLTDEEIDRWTPEIHVVIRAIEAKLKEKNT